MSFKLVLVGVMLALTLLHDLSMGPRAVHIDCPPTEDQRQVIIWLARLNLVLVLVIIFCGVWLTEV